MKKTFTSIAVLASLMVTSSVYAQDAYPGKVVIDEVDDISAEDQTQLFDELSERFPGLTLKPSTLEKETKIEIASVADDQVEDVIKFLKSNDKIQHVQPLFKVQAYGLLNYSTPNDPMYSRQWSMKTVGVESAWGYTQGEGATVAVVDTGVDCTLEDLKGTSCGGGWNIVDDDDKPVDRQSHGSHVAGTIAQTTNNGIGVAGVASRVKIMPVKVLSDEGWGSDVDVADGIRWAADHGANVINLSLGGPQKSQVQVDAVNHALSKGVFIAAANGNDPRQPIGYPAAIPGVFAVSATDSQNHIAQFSTRGPQTAIGAPGVDILQQTVCNGRSADCPNYAKYSGTSMATPHVAAVAGLLVSQGVTDPEAIRERLQSSATTTDETKKSKNNFGAGILSASSAVSQESNHQAFVRGLFALLFTFLLFRKSDHKASWKFMVPAFVTGVGLFFVPWVVSFAHPVTFAVSRPLVELTSLFDVHLTNWLALANVAVPGLALVASWHWKSLRMSVAGVSVGVAAYLASTLWMKQMFFSLPFWVTTGWMVANILGCLYLARFALKHLTSDKEEEKVKENVGKVTTQDVDTTTTDTNDNSFDPLV